jgi:hypothetical protein
MFRALAVCFVLSAGLAGCGKKGVGFTASDFHYGQMAVDAAYRLSATYLPAKTAFVLRGDADNGVFVAALSAKLREMGFSVYEGGGVEAGVVLKPRVLFMSAREAVVVMSVGDVQLQRGYDLLDGDIAPGSYWVRREE